MPIAADLRRPGTTLTTLRNGRHAWLSDVAPASGGDDLAPDPHDLLDAALAACTVLTLELYIRRKQLAVSHLHVAVTHTEERQADGRVAYRLQRHLTVEGELADTERQRLLDIANKCPIHKVLTGDITVDTGWASAAPAPEAA